MGDRVVVFVCEHGAGRSRIAAAWFNGLAIDGWTATSAGPQPQERVSAHAARLLAGTPVERLLDLDPPRALSTVRPGEVTVAIDCSTNVPGAARWTLAHPEFTEAMRDEIRDRVRELGAGLDAGGRQ